MDIVAHRRQPDAAQEVLGGSAITTSDDLHSPVGLIQRKVLLAAG
jgi:hypothetical protein